MFNTKKYINLEDIHLIYRHRPSLSTLNKIHSLIEEGNYPELIVNYDQENNMYHLADGFKEYEALYVYNPRLTVPCLIAPYKGRIDQIYTILNKDSYTKTPLLVKYDLIHLLFNEGASIDDIANKLQISIDTLRRYIIKQEVPRKYILRGIKNNAAHLLNNICNSIKPNQIKTLLYKRAVLPETDKNRLTEDQLEIVKLMLMETDIASIPNIETLEYFVEGYGLKYKDVLKILWREKLDKLYLKRLHI